MRVLNGPKVWLYHAATQSAGLLLAVIGAGMGIWIAMTTDQVGRSPLPDSERVREKKEIIRQILTTAQLDSAHAIIGLLLFASIWLIAFGGMLQHMAFRKYKRRTIIGHIHTCGLPARFLRLLSSMEGWDWRLLGVELGRRRRMALLRRLCGWRGWVLRSFGREGRSRFATGVRLVLGGRMGGV
jgi:hypothetical protein